GKNSLNRLIRCVCGKKIGPDPRNFNQRVSLGRNDLLIRTFPRGGEASPYSSSTALEKIQDSSSYFPQSYLIVNLTCAQCSPRHACPLNGALLMQVHDRAQGAPVLARERDSVT
ncbi:hypothetical protein, partial [Enterobacter roggenkampii]|uniref:hypothetical protein n=1 Tax=Enterobacter roggenkampii TaxID=1812935 RepID=UPI002DB7FD9E